MSDAPHSGLVRGFFHGRLDADALLPFPFPDDETRETTDEITSMVAEWARDAIDPEAIDRQKSIPREVIEGMAELGLFGLTIPTEYGGAGCGQWTYAHVMEAVAHRCASTVTVLGGHLGIGMKALLLYGTPEQKQRWLPALASGERIAAFALTEAGAGSDAAALRTTADRLDDGSWKLNGRKVWITNGAIANVFTVFARTPAEGGGGGLMDRPISAFFVPGELAGVSIGAPEDKLGLCGSSTTEVGLEDVVLPADGLIGPEGEGFKVALNVLNGGRHGLAATCVGQAKLARDLAVAHAREREQFGRPIAAFGMVQELLAGMDADIYAMEAGTWLTAGRIDRGTKDVMLESACCKMFATEALWRIANDALQVTGGTGFMREYPYERIIRDARINMIFEGTNQILRWMVAGQGLRGLENTPSGAPVDVPPFDAAFADEGRQLAELVPVFAERARRTAATYGKAARDAQLPLKRLADMATALFGMGAVLARATAEAGDTSTAVARLAFRRRLAELRAALAADDDPCDADVATVAEGMTGIPGTHPG